MREFDEEDGGCPRFSIIVSLPDGDEAANLTVSWDHEAAGIPALKRPISIGIRPVHRGEGEEDWETCVDLSREDARMVRDMLDLMLRIPEGK